MNRTLLAMLQMQRSFPSVTLLLNTTPRRPLDEVEFANAKSLIGQVDSRLELETDPALRETLVATLTALLNESKGASAGSALALCASPEYAAAIRLGQPVNERVIIDETFATRDLVADLNRTALYRVVTVSEGRTRLFIGDRQRLVEEQSDSWPMTRAPEQNPTQWAQAIAQAVKGEHEQYPLPIVAAGTDRPVRQLLSGIGLEWIGVIRGNHDRTGWFDLHAQVWPLVSDWLEADHEFAVKRLDDARSQRRYAGGINEIWPLANEGRVELLVVEDTYALAAMMDGQHFDPADDPAAPGVVDDLVDETIEVVMGKGGTVVIVADQALRRHDRIAAVVRY